MQSYAFLQTTAIHARYKPKTPQPKYGEPFDVIDNVRELGRDFFMRMFAKCK